MQSLFPELSNSADNPDTWINAHCDGGARGNPGPAGYGAVLVDEHGATLAELSEFLGVRTNNVAEYAGLLGVLQWTLDHGHKRLRVTSDSLLMVKQMKGQYKVASPDLKPMWEEARRRSRALDAFEITHALRHKNKVADRLANEAMDRGMGRGTGGSFAPKAAAPRTSPSSGRTSAPQDTANKDGDRRGSSPLPAQRSTPVELHGVMRDGVVRLLDGGSLPEGTRVRIITG